MGNPALEEFQEKFANELLTAFHDTADLLEVDGARLTGMPPLNDIQRAVNTVTVNWQAEYNRRLLRDARGVLHDGLGVRSEIYDPIHHVVRIEVSTHVDRDESPEETAEQRERLAALKWEPEQGPPPRRVGLLQLLRQGTWWVPKGSEPIRLADMADSHRHNLASFLRRNAARYKRGASNSMLWSMAGPLGPSGDMAQDAAESALNELEDMDPLKWIAEQPLFQALVPVVYLWPAGQRPVSPTQQARWTCHAVRDDGLLIASANDPRRKVATRAIQPPAAENLYRGILGGIGPAFYRLIELKPRESLPPAVHEAFLATGGRLYDVPPEASP